MAKSKVLVVGAGLAGATAARILAERGHHVQVIEKRKHLAGNCYDYKNSSGLTVHAYGPHLFHTNEAKVWAFCQQFARFRHFQHRVLSYVDGRLLPFPINRDTLCELYGVSLSNLEVAGFLQQEVARASFNDPPENFRDVIVSQVGEYLYQRFFENYTRKQWQTDPEQLSKEIAGRIPVRHNRDDRYFTDRYQGVPQKGYTQMIEKMLEHPQITIQVKTDFFKFRQEADLEQKYARIIYTGRLDKFFDCRLGELKYRSVQFEFETLDQAVFQPAAVVNYPNDYDFTRITEFKHITGEQHARTVICREYPSEEGTPSYVVLNQENLERRAAYLDLVQELEATGRYHFVGRLAEYRYYNMDQVIWSVMEKLA